MTPINERKQRWTPAPRPEWVQKINEEGYCMDIRGIVPLDADSLLASAKQATGLDDFGADDWYEPFCVLAAALDGEEAALNLMGRIRSRSELLMMLQARLKIEDEYKRHPEIADEQIIKPFVVLGQGRSGTSFLVNLLAANPDNGVIKHWEAMFPCPPPEAATYLTDPRSERGHKLIDQWNRVTPNFKALHEFTGQLPVECAAIMALNFNSPQWLNMLGQTPSYNAAVAGLDIMPTLEYHKRVLKLLQWKNPRKHWAIKSISHLDMMPDLLKVYPDACFIWPHRDPIRALASAMNFIGTAHWGRSDFPLKDDSFDVVLDPEFSAMRMNAAIDQIDQGIVPEARIYNLLYRDLVAEPLTSIERIYQHFNIVLTDGARAAIARYIAENPREIRPPHKVDKGSEEMIARDRKIFQRYTDRFGIPEE